MKNKFISTVFIGLVFAVTSINASAGFISPQTVNLTGGNSFSNTFSSFDSGLGQLTSVALSYDITFNGSVLDDNCLIFEDCDGTRTLEINLNGFTDSNSIFIDNDVFNDVFNYVLNLNVNDVVNFNPSNFLSGVPVFSVSTFCSGDCFNAQGNSALTGTATLSYRYIDVPEPSTIAIFILGLMGVASRRFKSQR